MPPEAIAAKPDYNEKLDVFSFGCVTIHAITEKFPIPTDQFVESHTKISDQYVESSSMQSRQIQKSL